MNVAMLCVIDTHVLIWHFIGSPRLRSGMRERLDRVRQDGGRLLIPTIVLAEALDIARKGRMVFDFDEMYRVLYIASFKAIVYVLHAFQKKTEKTSKQDVDTARRALKEVLGRSRS